MGKVKTPKSLTLSRVAEVQLRLPVASPTGRRIREILRLLVTLSGQAVVEMGRIVKPGLLVEKDADDKRVTKVSLIIPANFGDDVEEARNFLNPNRSRCQKRGNKKENAETAEIVMEAPSQPSAAWLALPAHLKLNSYGLVGLEERPDNLPLLIFRLVEEYGYQDGSGKEKKCRWTLPPLYLQGMIQRWIPAASRALLPRSVQQDTCQEVTQQVASHWSLQEDASQPFTSFPSFAEREPEERRRLWRQALLRLSHRTEPFAQRKCGSDTVIDNPDIKLVRASPYPGRMTARFIGSGDVVIWRRTSGCKLYASLPIWKSVGDDSPLLRFLEQKQKSGKVKLFWWRDCVNEFIPLPAWPEVRLEAKYEWLMVPIADEKGRLQEWLSDSKRRVCWSIITERQVQGQPEFYLQVITQTKVKPRLRPNLLAILPTMEEGEHGPQVCLRYALIKEGKLVLLERQVVDSIPTGPAKRGRSWRKSRQQRAIRVGREIASLADELDANLAIGEIAWLDKRSGDAEANTRASRFNYADLIRAIENKAGDFSAPVAIVARISHFERQKICPTDKSAEEQVAAVARLAWERWESGGKMKI